jgi:hypothetical protein
MDPYKNRPDYSEPFASREHGLGGREDVPQPSGMVSGSITLSIPAGKAARPASPSQVVRWQAHDAFPSALTLLLDVRGQVQPTRINPFAGQEVAFAQADGEAATNLGWTGLGGMMRLVYGAGNVLHVREADLRSGSYAVPACTMCTVEAFLYLTGPSARDVSATLIPVRSEQAARLINTARVMLTAGGTAGFRVPYGARWVSLSGGDNRGTIGAGQANIALYEGGHDGVSIILDYGSGTFVGSPGQMVELSGDRSDVIVKNYGAADATVTVRFALEL